MSKKWKVALGILAAVVIVAGIATAVVRRVSMRNRFLPMMESRELPETQEDGRFLPWDRMRMRPGMFPGSARGFSGMRSRIGGIAFLFIIPFVLAVGIGIGLAIGLVIARSRHRPQPNQPQASA